VFEKKVSIANCHRLSLLSVCSSAAPVRRRRAVAVQTFGRQVIHSSVHATASTQAVTHSLKTIP
jgi:hypothetical protein